MLRCTIPQTAVCTGGAGKTALAECIHGSTAAPLHGTLSTVPTRTLREEVVLELLQAALSLGFSLNVCVQTRQHFVAFQNLAKVA